MFFWLSYHLLEKTFNPIIYFTKIFISTSKLHWISVNLQKFISVQYFSIIELISIVCLSKNILNHWTSIDQSLSHSIVFQRYDVVIFVVVARWIQIIECLVIPLYLHFLFTTPSSTTTLLFLFTRWTITITNLFFCS